MNPKLLLPTLIVSLMGSAPRVELAAAGSARPANSEATVSGLRSNTSAPWQQDAALAPTTVTQSIVVRVTDARNHAPVKGQTITITFFSKDDHSNTTVSKGLDVVTDAKGQAEVPVPSPLPSRMAARLNEKGAGYYCNCYLWLLKPRDVLSKGVVSSLPDGVAIASNPDPHPVPGEINFLVRPPPLWQKLLYPFLKD